MTVPIIILTLAVLVALIRPVTTIFHELGHGIAALFFSKGKVALFMGSYGDPNKSLNFCIGRLEFFFKRNPFHWQLGLCNYEGVGVTNNQNIIITILGPLVSLLVGGLIFYYTIIMDFHGVIKVLGFVFLLSSLFDFFINIVPNSTPIYLHDGTIGFNDGQRLVQLLKYRKMPSQYKIGSEYYLSKKYKEAAKIFHTMIENGLKKDFIYRFALTSYIQDENYQKAFDLNVEYEMCCTLTSNDFVNSGIIKSQLGLYEECLLDFQKSINLNENNIYAYNNRGYAYNLMEQYDKAILDFNSVFKIDPEYAYSYNNRGFAKIKLGYLDEGLKDIKFSISKDDKNAYAFRNLGIYYFEIGDFEKALEQFELAGKLDKDTPLLAGYLQKTAFKLSGKS